jgi:hypothetical protein
MKIGHIAPLLALASIAAAQAIRPLPFRGMMTAQSAGLVFESDLQTVVLKGAGLPARLDRFVDFRSPGVPDYSAKAIATYLESLTSVSVEVEIDAMSTGNDLLPLIFVPGSAQGVSPVVEPTFRVAVPAPGTAWATLSLVRQVPEQTVGADILGYYFDNPSFPPQLRNVVVHEAVRADFLPVGVDPGGSDIAALDYAMGQINAMNGRTEVGIIECVDRLYFSVTPASAAAIHALNVIPEVVDAATILVASYGSSGAVTALSWAGRPPGPEHLDVDALGAATVTSPVSTTVPTAVQVQPGTTMFLLSFAPSPEGTPPHGYEELLAYAVPDRDPLAQETDKELAPLRWTNGNRMIGTEQIPGQVKGICGRDPDWNLGAHTFGVPLVDGVGSVPVLSVEVGNPDTQRLRDVFKVRGVVAGAAYPGASVFLFVGHNGGYQPYPLGNWPGNQGLFSFDRDLDYKWRNDTGGSVPGVGLTCTNVYELMVVTISPGSMGPVFGVSTTCVLRRRDYD